MTRSFRTWFFRFPTSNDYSAHSKSIAILRYKFHAGSILIWWGTSQTYYLLGSPSFLERLLRRGTARTASQHSRSLPAGSSLDAAAWYAESGHSPGSGVSSSSWCYVTAAWRGMSRCGPGRSSSLYIPWCLEARGRGWDEAGRLSCCWWAGQTRAALGSGPTASRPGSCGQVSHCSGCFLLTSHLHHKSKSKSESDCVGIMQINTIEIIDSMCCACLLHKK